MPPTQNGHGDAILAQGAKASPRVKGHVVNDFFFETLVPLKDQSRMALFPRWSQLNTIATVSDALHFFNVEDDVWQAFLNQVGDCREDLRLVAALSRPAVLAGSGVAILPDGSALSPLQATQVGLVWRLARRVMAYHGGVTEDAFVDVEVWLVGQSSCAELKSHEYTNHRRKRRRSKRKGVEDVKPD